MLGDRDPTADRGQLLVSKEPPQQGSRVVVAAGGQLAVDAGSDGG